MTDLDHEANEAARHGNREALEAMTARCEWQPIETAPMDGNLLLLFEDSVGAVPGYWHERHNWIFWDGENGGLYNGGPDHSMPLTEINVWITGCGPTHWMPLPPPPALSDKGDG